MKVQIVTVRIALPEHAPVGSLADLSQMCTTESPEVQEPTVGYVLSVKTETVDHDKIPDWNARRAENTLDLCSDDDDDEGEDADGDSVVERYVPDEGEDADEDNDPPFQESHMRCVLCTVTVTNIPSPQTAADITRVLHAAWLLDTTLTDAAATICAWGYREDIPGQEWKDALRKEIAEVLPPGRLVGIEFRVDVL